MDDTEYIYHGLLNRLMKLGLFGAGYCYAANTS